MDELFFKIEFDLLTITPRGFLSSRLNIQTNGYYALIMLLGMGHNDFNHTLS